MKHVIHHDPVARAFHLDLAGERAVLSYEPAGDRVLDFQSTWVPPAHRGHGVGATLVRHALDWARAEGMLVIPTCWYVKQLMDREPEYGKLEA